MNHTDLDDEAFALLQRCAIPLRDDASSTVKRIATFYLEAHPNMLMSEIRTTAVLDGQPETLIGKAVQGIALQRRNKPLTRKRWLQQYVDQGYFEGARGARLPIGLPLHADYQGQKLEAKVTAGGIAFQGETFDNPSAAAVAAKKSCGAASTTAQSNGWTFWNIGKGSPQGMEPLNVLRNPLIALNEDAELAASIGVPHPDSYSGKYAGDDET